MEPNHLVPGDSVGFRLDAAVCPDFSDMLRSIGPELRVTGNVCFFSDGGDQKNHFAVIEVAGIHTPLIVPVDRLVRAAEPAERNTTELTDDLSRKVC